MLANEERDYIEEMEAKQETMEERQKKMAERAKVLKEKREIERQQIAQEKLDMQWRWKVEPPFTNTSTVTSLITKT